MTVLILWAALAAQSPQAEAAGGTAIIVSHRRDPDQVICEKVMPPGSRLVTKQICATQREWDQRRQDDRDNLDDITRHGLQWDGPPDG